MNNIVFCGHYLEVLEKMCELGLEPDYVLIEDKPSAKKVCRFSAIRKIQIKQVFNSKDLENVCCTIGAVELMVVAGFGLVLNSETVKMGGCVLNFHPGDVWATRGRHPLPAAILGRNPFMGITVHKIVSEEVDVGPVVRKVLIPIDYCKDYKFNDDRLTNALKLIAENVFKEYVNSGTLVAVDWEVPECGYYPPFGDELLEELFSVRSLSEAPRL